ncbi:MAG: DNA polymerase III subunit gamma/tau [Candidatus Bipolaricaulota bacterium]|nr:DNA polymerase III subunit gamma/tau [Candidatus Bipolaricaulota bacterium]
MTDAERLSLYRRFRPQRFADVVGQDLVVATLRRAVAAGKLGHAYLLSGQRGVGKTSVARILARAANCLAPKDGEPCNRCQSCLRILAGQSLDVVEIDGASNRGVDQIRRLREEVAYVPAGSRYKVYIIDEVHMLTGEAFNALLKTLEEPPPHVLFIFATTEPHKVPATVLSRCQAFEFGPIPDEAIARVLAQVAQAEGIALEPGAAELIARRSRGALRDALVVLDQLGHGGAITEARVVELLGLPPLSLVDGFLDALLARNADRALAVVGELAARGRDLALFVEEAAGRARDRIIAGEAALIPVAQRLIELRGELGRAFSRRLHLELAVIAHCGPPAAPPTEPPRPAQDRAASPPAQPDRGEQGGGENLGWEAMLKAVLSERPAVAAFLAPAAATWADGLLTIRLPRDCAYHHEALQDPQVRGYVEAVAHRFFTPLLAVEIVREGEREKPSLEEGARILAEALEGRVLREAGNG